VVAVALLASLVGGGGAHAGCSPTLEWQDAGPRWSPDGSRIAFYRVLPGCDPAPVAIYVVPARGGRARQVAATNGQWPASWSPDGRFLAFGGRSGIAMAQPDGRDHHEITRGPDYAPAWSPDGAWIAFRRGPYSVSELWIVRPDGTGARRLLGGLHDHALPAWSPDSRELAVSASAGISIDVRVVDLPTGAARTVAATPVHDLGPEWSPDGSVIAFTIGDAADPVVGVVGHDGTNFRRWIEGRDPVFAPDEQALAYVRSDGIWAETGPIGPTRLVPRADVLGRIDWRPRSGELPDFAFSAGGRCLRYGIYVVVDGTERRITNPCEFHGAGVVRGTPFADFLEGSPGPDRLLGGGRRDRLAGGPGDDVLDGDGGWDMLLGGSGDDVLIGRGDPDVLVGGPGRDRIDAGPFADTVRARDGWRDTIDCGPGIDTVEADAKDVVADDCERVAR
jgi:RTX calcium-binding nonapeptide repeat (4 copies)/WD40-like Beta Propeller Repeat